MNGAEPSGESITAEGIEDLKGELAQLEGPARREMAARIKAARELGDLKENADYHIAKEDQAHLETRIKRLQERLRKAVVVEVDAIGPGGVVLDADDLGLIEAALAVDVPVWVEAGVGRVMPPRLWEALVRRLQGAHIPRSGSVVGLDGIDRVAGPFGVQTVPVALACTDCPEPAELLARW